MQMKSKLIKLLLILLPVIFGLISIGVGRYEVDFIVQLKILASQVFPIEQTWSAMEESVVMNIRLPRILLAMLIGGGLSIAGAAFQGMFANPLVSPDILGVSAGAGFGASIGILLFGTGFTMQMFSLVVGMAAIGFYLPDRWRQKGYADIYACTCRCCHQCFIPSTYLASEISSRSRRKTPFHHVLVNGKSRYR